MSDTGEFSRFIAGLAGSLHATKILCLGCHSADDLAGFSPAADVSCVTPEPHMLDMLVERYPSFEFKQCDPSAVPYEDNRFDFVFSHKLFNYLDDARAKITQAEMYRVSSKYVVNFEMFSEAGGTLDKNGTYRGMYSEWLKYNVRIISNVQMHKDIDPEQCQFTLARKTE